LPSSGLGSVDESDGDPRSAKLIAAANFWISELTFGKFPQARFSFLIRENQQRGGQLGGLGVIRQVDSKQANLRMARDPREIWLPTLDAFKTLAA
jgi:hypothetical protein